jgi:glycosyltransferase involved in cell wall biosynthesis
MPLISVVIPVYKAEDCLQELYRRLKASLSTITEDFELIMIEDCGGDRSWEVIGELARNDPRVRGLQFTRNFGQHYGITAGLDYSRGAWVVVIDCDLQERPEGIPQLYAKAQEGFDVVIALRHKRKDPWYKRASAYVFYRLFNYLSGMNYDPDAGNLCIVSRQVVTTFQQMRENLRLFNGLVAWMGYPTAYIRVEHAERFSGESSYSISKQLRLATDAIIAYSDRPLRLTINIGILISMTSFVAGIYYLAHKLIVGQSIVGWTSLMVSIYFLGGIIISILGIIGIYVGKIFDETKKRPLYLVSRTTDKIPGKE